MISAGFKPAGRCLEHQFSCAQTDKLKFVQRELASGRSLGTRKEHQRLIGT